MDPEEYNEALMECLKDDQDAKSYFMELTPGHKRYFSNWIESAKTENTRINRIAKTLNALSKKWDYGMMLRAAKNS